MLRSASRSASRAASPAAPGRPRCSSSISWRSASCRSASDLVVAGRRPGLGPRLARACALLPCPAAPVAGTRAAAAGSCRRPAPAARAARRRGPASTAGPGRPRPAALPPWPIIICMFSSICCSISSSASASALRPCSESSWIRSISSWIWSWVIVWPGGISACCMLAVLDARRAPSAPCSRASPGAARPSAGRSPRRWRRSRSACCSRSLARASRSAASPRLPSSICTAACQSASAISSRTAGDRARLLAPAASRRIAVRTTR